MEEPGYPGAHSAFAAAGADIRLMPVDDHGINIESQADSMQDVRLAYVTPSHQFPLGVAMSLERRRILEQAILAEFMARGHYQRHLRRMRMAYMERLDALQRAIQSSGAPLLPRPVQSGLHLVADLDGVDAGRVFEEAKARGIEVMPLSHYSFSSGTPRNALVLGIAAVRPAAIRAGVSQLARAIEAAGRRAGH